MPDNLCDLTHPGIDYLVMGVVLGLCYGPRCQLYYYAAVDSAVDEIMADRFDGIEPGMIPERESTVKLFGADEALDQRAPHNAAAVFPS